MKKNFKKIVVSSLAMVMVASTVALTAPKITKKKIEATYGRVKFNYNGTDVTQQVENKYGTPGFISGGRSYVPVRALADVLGVDVDWNEKTDTVEIKGSSANEALLKQQINLKDIEIARLRAELEKKENNNSDMSIRDLESQLIKDYKDFERIDLRINLRGDDRRVDLEIDVDLGRSSDKDRWDDIRESTIERLIEDMVRDIQREYRDADVSGYIRDSDAREDLYTFEKRGNRSIDITKKGSSASSRDIERFLDDKFSKIDGVRIRSFKAKEDSSDRYEITVRLEDNEGIVYGKILNFYDDVIDSLEREYRKIKIDRIELVNDKTGSNIDTWRK